MVVRLRDTLIPGSARVPRAGERVLAIANFIYAAKLLESTRVQKESPFRRDAETNMRDACATRSQITAAVPLTRPRFAAKWRARIPD